MIEFAHPQPPLDAAIPVAAQTITTVIYGAGAVVFAAYAVHLAFKRKSFLPVALVVGAMLTVFLEPVVDLLGNALHPPEGLWQVIATNGHPVPWLVLLGYVWYFAGAPLLVYRTMAERTLTRGDLWKVYVGILIGAAIVEQVPLIFGVWTYYGAQPLKIGLMPSWWIFANAACVMVPLALIYRFFPDLSDGFKSLLVIPLMPTAAFMGHAGAGWPMYNALGTSLAIEGGLALTLTGLASILLSIWIVWGVMEICSLPRGNNSPKGVG